MYVEVADVSRLRHFDETHVELFATCRTARCPCNTPPARTSLTVKSSTMPTPATIPVMTCRDACDANHWCFCCEIKLISFAERKQKLAERQTTRGGWQHDADVRREYQCAECNAHTKPQLYRKAILPRTYEFNRIIALDVHSLAWPLPILNIICHGTNFQVLALMRHDDLQQPRWCGQRFRERGDGTLALQMS